MSYAHPLNAGEWCFPDVRGLAEVVKFMDEVEKEPHRLTRLAPNTGQDQRSVLETSKIDTDTAKSNISREKLVS